jgi:hypothetical protein
MNYVIENGLWETDFVLKELLPKGEVYYPDTCLIESVYMPCDVFAFSCRVHDFWNIRNTLKRIRPKIVIMFSDELYQENKWDYNMIGTYCNLFLRQYHHSFYNYTPNTLHIPLGYTNGCESFISQKKYDWSFVGNMKSDRDEMLNVFSQLPNHFIGNDIGKKKMCEIYSQSIFVSCGRGHSSLDCFRLYEASMNGAIPVVVGEEKEIKETFKYEENPPWIFANTWEEAYQKCLSNTISSEEVMNWWNRRILKIRSKIEEILM